MGRVRSVLAIGSLSRIFRRILPLADCGLHKQAEFPQAAAIFAGISEVVALGRFCHDGMAMNISDHPADTGIETARLAEAFRVFSQASEELATAYGALERQVESLTAELAAANAEADRLREEAERNKRLAAMGEMAAQLAHQLRTPLAAALLYAGNLENPDLPEDSRVSIAQKTVSRLKHLEHLIQDMLLFARGEVLGRETFPVAELLTDLAHIFEPLARSRGVEFRIEMVAGETSLTGNRKALTGALTNLVDNAFHAVGNGGQVVVSAARIGGQLLFTVRDDGPGMAPDVVVRLFEPFFTTRSDGTGLGLAIARGVARAHGGGIDVRSEPGVGTEFLITLPLNEITCQSP
jgi:signal transduction histidine kinase